MKGDKKGRAYITHGRDEKMHAKFWPGNLKRRSTWET
jgi:hypothetical protein